MPGVGDTMWTAGELSDRTDRELAATADMMREIVRAQPEKTAAAFRSISTCSDVIASGVSRRLRRKARRTIDDAATLIGQIDATSTRASELLAVIEAEQARRTVDA